MNKKICIIPARGGSKRISKKNIKLFLGKPIIYYSIKAALESNLFDEVMVSTDDQEIKDIAKSYGANVPFLRSKKNSNDFATTFDVIDEVIEKYKEIGKTFGLLCCIYPCAPFVTKNRINEALVLLEKNNYYSVLPIMEFSFPIQRALKKDKNNKVTFNNPINSLKRSQDLKKMYHDAGQFYWIDYNKCRSSREIIGNNSGAIIISQIEGQDIDNITDWKLAELKFKFLKNLN